MNSSNLVRVAAVVMFLGIAMGAFGAHGLEEILEQNGRVDTWETAARYHLVQGVAMFALALFGHRAMTAPFWLWLMGIVLFSGSLYALSLTNIGKFGAITPFGGFLFLIGWGWVIAKAGAVRK